MTQELILTYLPITIAAVSLGVTSYKVTTESKRESKRVIEEQVTNNVTILHELTYIKEKVTNIHTDVENIKQSNRLHSEKINNLENEVKHIQQDVETLKRRVK